MAESLGDKSLPVGTETSYVFRQMPSLNAVKPSGPSIIDRGRGTLLPILDEIVPPENELLILTRDAPDHPADPPRATADHQGPSEPETTRLLEIASPCGRRCKIEVCGSGA